MSGTFDRNLCLAHLVKGKLRAAMEYAAGFPEQAELCRRYGSLFQEEKYLTYDVDDSLQEILLAYQKYYRDAFYLEQSPEEAAEGLRLRLAELFQAGPAAPLDELEEKVADAFRSRSLYALCGRTGGYYGPYIWRTEELKQYAVELPDGTRDYAVKLLDGFVMESWLSYLTFGMSGTGGWSNGDGLIHCIKSNYDLDSESFRVSLLKHEVQHAADQDRYPGMSSEDLEYRAKLVELVYSEERRMLDRFLREADETNAGNSHGLAAERIVRGFEARTDKPREELTGLPVQEVRSIALALFRESAGEMDRKYFNPPA